MKNPFSHGIRMRSLPVLFRLQRRQPNICQVLFRAGVCEVPYDPFVGLNSQIPTSHALVQLSNFIKGFSTVFRIFPEIFKHLVIRQQGQGINRGDS